MSGRVRIFVASHFLAGFLPVVAILASVIVCHAIAVDRLPKIGGVSDLDIERIVLLSGGTVASQGRAEEVLTPEKVQAAYGVAVACDRNPATGVIRITSLQGMPTKQE